MYVKTVSAIVPVVGMANDVNLRLDTTQYSVSSSTSASNAGVGFGNHATNILYTSPMR